MYKNPWLIAIGLSLVFSVQVLAQECNWQWVSPVPPQKDINRMVAAQDQFVAVGDHGLVETSFDGVQWMVGDSGVRSHLYGIAFGDGQYVAVGDEVVLTGVDGLHWPVAATFDGVHFNDVAWGGGRWVVTAERGSSGRVLTSYDGQSWQWVFTGEESSTSTVEWDGSRFVVIRSSDVLTSTDGLVWEVAGTVDPVLKKGRRPPAKTAVERQDLAFDGEQYYLTWFGYNEVLLASTDLVSWSDGFEMQWFDGRSFFQAVYAEPGMLVVGGYGDGGWVGAPWESLLVSSTDGGQSWSHPFGTHETFLGRGIPAIARNGSTFAAAGAGGAVFLSADGINWTCRYGPGEGCETKGGGFDELDVAGPMYLALGGRYWGSWTAGYNDEGLAAVSADGQQWQRYFLPSRALSALAWSGSFYLGARGDTVVRSSDGLSWEVFEQVTDGHLYDLAYGAGLFVAVGSDGEISTSADGAIWTRRDSGTETALKTVLWDGSRFTVGNEFGGFMLTSSDGIDWSFHDLGEGSPPMRMVFTGSDYVGVTRDEILVSQDGLWWQTVATVADGYLFDVAWNGEFFVAVGRIEIGGAFDYSALVLASRDGRAWTHFTPFGSTLKAVEWTGDAFLAVGASMLRTTCVGVLAELEPTEMVLHEGETGGLTLTLSEVMDSTTTIQVASSDPDLVSVPETVQIAAGSRWTTIPVHGLVSGEGITVSVHLPMSLGGGIVHAEVAVKETADRCCPWPVSHS